MRRLLLLSLLVLLLPWGLLRPASTAVRYVSNAAPNDNTPCPDTTNISTPRKTLAGAMACMQGGDTLRVRGGTYTNQCLSGIPSGTAGAPTIIQAEPGEEVWLRDTQQCGEDIGPITFAAGQQYIIVDGINVNCTGVWMNGITLGSDANGIANSTVRNLIIRYCKQGLQGPSHYCTFENMTVEHCGFDESLTETCQQPELGCHGYYVTGNNNLFTRNTIYHCTGIGMTLSCEGCGGQVHDNVITRTRVSGGHGDGILLYANNAIYDSIIHHNRFNGNSVGIKTGGDATIVNNTIYDNDAAGIQFNSGTSLVRNNIVLDNDGAALNNYGGDRIADTNICNSGCDLTGSAALLMNPGAGDFRPASGSVASVNAANQSVPAGTPSVDYTGTARSSGGARDIGAYEFVATVAGTELRFGQPPTTTRVGQVMSPVTVRVTDSAGNTDTTSSAVIFLQIAINPGGGTLGGYAPTAAVNGVATFSTLSINAAGVGYTLAATANQLTGTTSPAFTITLPPTALRYVQAPTTTQAGQVMSPPVTVEVIDANGTRDTTSSATVFLAIQANPGGGALGGSLPQTAVSGLATFADLSISAAGENYTLRATAGGLTEVTSPLFTITPPPPPPAPIVPGNPRSVGFVRR